MAEPRPSPTRGEFVSLRDHFESRLQAIEKGIDVANQSMQSRLAGMNEFRDTLKDQASRFTTRDELNSKLDSLNERLVQLERSRALLEGKASQSQVNMTMIISLLGLLLGVIGLLVKFLP